MTRPPIISGIHISAPVRAVVPLMDDEAWVVLLFELELEFELEFELELELCALATPAMVKVMTNARNAPAKNFRAVDPVVRTFPTLPKLNAFLPTEFVAGDHDSCIWSSSGPATNGTLAGSSRVAKASRLPSGPDGWHHARR
jgi:hypothetical protein